MEEFKDAKLKSGYGRNCLNCKKDNKKPRKLTKRKSASKRKAQASGPPLRQESKITCSQCGAKLVVKARRVDGGKFLSCPNWKFTDKNHDARPLVK